MARITCDVADKLARAFMPQFRFSAPFNTDPDKGPVVVENFLPTNVLEYLNHTDSSSDRAAALLGLPAPPLPPCPAPIAQWTTNSGFVALDQLCADADWGGGDLTRLCGTCLIKLEAPDPTAPLIPPIVLTGPLLTNPPKNNVVIGG